MSLELAIAGFGCFVLALGHAAVGVRSVLPSLRKVGLPRTRFGGPSMTFSMVRFTWHIVTLMLAAFGILLVTLASAPHADTKTLLLRWLGALWLAATAMAFWNARRRPLSILRFPVPLVFVVIAATCLTAST